MLRHACRMQEEAHHVTSRDSARAAGAWHPAPAVAPPRPAARGPASGLELRFTLVLLLALHALSGALILPTLPLLKTEYGAAAQWAYSALIFGFGATQIPWGVLADRHGRRPALLAGLSMFALASMGCVAAAQLWQLVACRFVQGAGVAAAGVCARAVIRDLHTGDECVRMLSTCFSWIGAVALLGPPVAGMLITRQGAAGALVAYAAIGCFTLVFCLLRLPETRAAHAPVAAAGADWRGIVSHPAFRVYTALTAFSYIGNYAFLTGSSFLLMGKHGMSVVGYGGVLSAASVFYTLGTIACRRVMSGLGVQRTVCLASLLGQAAGTAMLLAAWTGGGKAWGIVLPYLGFIFAHAIHQSCGQAAAMTPFAASAAQASAILGTILPVAAVTVGWLLAPALADSWIALPTVMFAASSLVAVTAWRGVRTRGHVVRR
jgi:DHA1 family bicyclomycin/chloramphenicol resistance-like MFS transporter